MPVAVEEIQYVVLKQLIAKTYLKHLGMAVTTVIKTRHKRITEYFMDPVLNIRVKGYGKDRIGTYHLSLGSRYIFGTVRLCGWIFIKLTTLDYKHNVMLARSINRFPKPRSLGSVLATRP